MSEPRDIRTSRTPLVFRCGGSAQAPELAVDEVSGASDLGVAAHEALRVLAETGSIDWDSLPAIAARHGVSLDELRMLCGIGNKLWPLLAASFPDALTEVALAAEIGEGVRLTGHIDLLSITGTIARAGDWKSGRKDHDYGHQMRGYGALVLLDNPDITEVTVTVIWLRDQEIENYTLTRDDAREWLASLVEAITRWNGVYRVGPHCGFCPRFHECAAANAVVRRDVAAIADKSLVIAAESELAQMTNAQIIELAEKAEVVARFAQRVRDAIRDHVIANGEIEAGGMVLSVDTDNRRQLDPLLAWPVLSEIGFTDEDFARCIDMRISKVSKIVAGKAKRGKGAHAVRLLNAALEKSGAIEIQQVHKLAIRRAQ